MSDQFWAWIVGLFFAFAFGMIVGCGVEVVHRYLVLRKVARDSESWQKQCDLMQSSILQLDRLFGRRD